MIGAVTIRKTGRFVTNPKAVAGDIQNGMEAGLRRSSFILRKAIIAKMSKKGGRDPFWGRTTDPDGLLVRTGLTRARISPGGRVYRHGNVSGTAIGSPDEHVRQLEEGGDVGPGPGHRFLRIATAAAQTSTGADKYAGMSIRQIAGARLWWNPHAQNLWAVRRKGAFGPQTKGSAARGQRDEFLYKLVRKIHTRGRHIFSRSIGEVRPAVMREVGAGVTLAVQRANQ